MSALSPRRDEFREIVINRGPISLTEIAHRAGVKRDNAKLTIAETRRIKNNTYFLIYDYVRTANGVWEPRYVSGPGTDAPLPKKEVVSTVIPCLTSKLRQHIKLTGDTDNPFLMLLF